jgi:hypothetical protein
MWTHKEPIGRLRMPGTLGWRLLRTVWGIDLKDALTRKRKEN